ncbi:MAG: flagellar biosynthetic protein FliO [Planctomycetes bacterium]|nr:flagellar biosynthetic protein FliO [Planctomycetota bacterium]
MKRVALLLAILCVAASAAQQPASAPAGVHDDWNLIQPAAPIEAGRVIRRRGAETTAEKTTTNRTTNTTSSWFRTGGALAAVVAVILFLSWGAKALGGGNFGRRLGRTRAIEVVSRTALSPRQSLCLVRVGQRIILIGITPDSIRTLDVIASPEEAAALAGSALSEQASRVDGGFEKKLRGETLLFTAAAAEADVVPNGAVGVRAKFAERIARLRNVAKRA